MASTPVTFMLLRQARAQLFNREWHTASSLA